MLVAARSNIMSEAAVVSSIDGTEMVMVKCVFLKRITYICCLYIPSGSRVVRRYTLSILLLSTAYLTLLVADRMYQSLSSANIPSLKLLPDPDNSNVFLPTNVGTGSRADVVHALMAGGLSQINHVVNYQDTLLDLVFCNDVDDIEVLKCEAPLIKIDTYHDPIEIYVAIPPMIHQPMSNSFDFKKADFNSSCTDSAVNVFYDVLHDIKKLKNNTHPPWYSKQVLKLKNVKSKTTRLICDYNMYSAARRKLVESQRTALANGVIHKNNRNEPA